MRRLSLRKEGNRGATSVRQKGTILGIALSPGGLSLAKHLGIKDLQKEIECEQLLLL